MRNITTLFLLFIICLSVDANKKAPPFLNEPTVWVDSLMDMMTLEQKIGQLIMVTTYPSQGKPNEDRIISWIKNYHVGGVLFLKTSPHELASRANNYQSESLVPLYIAIDAENGLSFRMDSVVRYPHAMGLGALTNDRMIYQMGREVGQQCKALGINLNFAPVADVNSNPNNPIINYRSFGENPMRVAQKSWQMAKGMQDERVMVTAKHFPGHGDTAYDSHLTLPKIDRNYALLDAVDFVPFKTCIDSGIVGIMTAHINMSGIDQSGLPATLSKKVMTGVLKDSLGFNGLVFSDGMNMKGITMHFTEGEAAVRALNAGVDVIEFIENPAVVVKAIKDAIEKGEIDKHLIDEKCRRVLLSKKWLGLDQYQPVNLIGLHKTINSPQYQLTSRLLYEQTITVIKNRDTLLPLQRLDTLRIATLAIGNSNTTDFQKSLDKYMDVDHFYIPLYASNNEIYKILALLKNYNLVIAGVHGTRLTPANNYNVFEKHKQVVEKLSSQNKTILVFFANPYSLINYELDEATSIVVTYGENYYSQTYAAQLIFGAIENSSTLPVTINKFYTEGMGEPFKNNGRLKYTVPEEVGFDAEKLKSVIDTIAKMGIREKAFPGCQVLIAKNGKVIFHESYGYHTYDSIVALSNDHMYDWASITKVTGPLPILMKMVEDSLISLDQPFSNYWEGFRNTDKELITLREILAHQSRLRSWIPFYLEVAKKEQDIRDLIVRESPSVDFPIRISTNLYIHKDYRQKIYQDIQKSELLKKQRYIYSDLTFHLFPELITKQIGVAYETYHNDQFISRLGASTVHYNPYRFYSKDEFVPTELDVYFRKELLQGYVHDEVAAMLGGVSGNAGLFGTTNDLAKIMQFYLQKGSYGDFQFLKPETVNEFTSVQYSKNDNRRALGFDKPYIDNFKRSLKDAFPAPSASPESFGHTGYTGTFVWVDPKNQLLFVFMSNRVYPTRDNTKLTQLNLRPTLHQSVYDCQNTFRYVSY